MLGRHIQSYGDFSLVPLFGFAVVVVVFLC